MPYIAKREYDDLVRAGKLMSNYCFNRSQDSKNPDADRLKELQMDWDRTLRSVWFYLARKR